MNHIEHNHNLKQIRRLPKGLITPVQAVVLGWIATYTKNSSTDSNVCCYGTLKRIAEETLFSEASIKRSLKALKTIKLIRIEKEQLGHGYYPRNIYFINWELVATYAAAEELRRKQQKKDGKNKAKKASTTAQHEGEKADKKAESIAPSELGAMAQSELGAMAHSELRSTAHSEPLKKIKQREKSNWKKEILPAKAGKYSPGISEELSEDTGEEFMFSGFNSGAWGSSSVIAKTTVVLSSLPLLPSLPLGDMVPHYHAKYVDKLGDDMASLDVVDIVPANISENAVVSEDLDEVLDGVLDEGCLDVDKRPAGGVCKQGVLHAYTPTPKKPVTGLRIDVGATSEVKSKAMPAAKSVIKSGANKHAPKPAKSVQSIAQDFYDEKQTQESLMDEFSVLPPTPMNLYRFWERFCVVTHHLIGFDLAANSKQKTSVASAMLKTLCDKLPPDRSSYDYLGLLLENWEDFVSYSNTQEGLHGWKPKVPTLSFLQSRIKYIIPFIHHHEAAAIEQRQQQQQQQEEMSLNIAAKKHLKDEIAKLKAQVALNNKWN